MRLQLIRIKAFRGISDELQIQIKGRGLLLLGDNGTGKSSVVEGIELALTGDVSTLRGREGISPSQHAHHINYTRADSVAVVEVGRTATEVLEISKGKPSGTLEAKSFLSACSSPTFILRRKQLLDFVDAQDGRRYQTLYPFLGIQEFDKKERILKKLRDEADADSRVKTSRRDRLIDVLVQEFQVHQPFDSVQSEVVRILQDRASQLGLASADASVSDLKTLAKVALGESSPDIDLLMKAERAKEELQKIAPSLSSAHLSEVAAKKEIKNQKEVELRGNFYHQVLVQGKQWIIEDSLDACPLCEQPIGRDLILNRIEERIQEHELLVRARQEYELVLENAKASYEETKRYYVAAKAAFRTAATAVSWPLAQHFTEIAGRIADFLRRPTEEEASSLEQAIARLLAQTNVFGTVESILDSYIEEHSVDARQQALAELIAKCSSYLASSETLNDFTASARDASWIASVASQIYSAAVEARKQVSDKTLTRIEERIGAIYTTIHPNEQFTLSNSNVITLRMDPDKRASATLDGAYANVGYYDPRAYYSESHLDTLGLAIFLAFREEVAERNPDFKLLILDDVMSSIDGPHRKRVAEFILNTYASSYQLVITTHDPIWFDYLSSMASGLPFEKLRFSDWTLDTGPLVLADSSAIDRLRKLLAGGNAQDLASTAGRLFEGMLQELRFALDLAVTAKRGENYTIADIWPTLVSRRIKKNSALETKIGAAANRLGAVTRNIGAHGDEWKKALSDGEAKEFAQDVLTLHDAVHCSTCHTYIFRDQGDQSKYRCKCMNVLYNSTLGNTKGNSNLSAQA
jgi:hypothetical protein